jgi:membrane-associated protease RseP (regulator of RpoE activity)
MIIGTLLSFIPINWVIHEYSHALAAWLVGNKVNKVKIVFFGKSYCEYGPRFKKAITFAGPCASFLTCMMCIYFFPKFEVVIFIYFFSGMATLLPFDKEDDGYKVFFQKDDE